MVLLYRWLVLDTHGEGDVIAARKKAREEKTGKSYGILTIINYYKWRLLGTGKETRLYTYSMRIQKLKGCLSVSFKGGAWFVWDITFYGLKLFSGPIFSDINPSGDLIVNNGYLLLNNVIALTGYYLAAAVSSSF